MDHYPIEVNVGQALVTFDGRVVESFGPNVNTNGRMHAATLKRAWLDDAGGKIWIRMETVWNTSQVMVPVAPERRALAEQLVEKINSVMAHYQAG